MHQRKEGKEESTMGNQKPEILKLNKKEILLKKKVRENNII